MKVAVYRPFCVSFSFFSLYSISFVSWLLLFFLHPYFFCESFPGFFPAIFFPLVSAHESHGFFLLF